MMEMDFYYIKMFVSPLLGFSVALLVMKCCCKHRCFTRSSANELQRRNTPIYIIPIPVNNLSFDEGSQSSMATFTPPAYDSVVSDIPPPPYSERKISVSDEEPPAYDDIIEEPQFVCSLSPATQHTQNSRRSSS